MGGEKSVGDLSSMLGSILSDPAQMTKLTQLAGALASSGGLGALLGGAAPTNHEGAASNQTAPLQEQKQVERDAQTEMSELVVPQAQADTRSTNASNADALTAALSKLNIGARKGQISKHEALLRALRPYLSNERQSRIDNLLRLLTLADVLGGVLQLTGENGPST